MPGQRHGRQVTLSGYGTERFGIGQRELGRMQVVGEGDGGKEESEDADQSRKALPLPPVRRAGAQLGQPAHAPDDHKRGGDRQPDCIEKKFHAGTILVQGTA